MKKNFYSLLENMDILIILKYHYPYYLEYSISLPINSTRNEEEISEEIYKEISNKFVKKYSGNIEYSGPVHGLAGSIKEMEIFLNPNIAYTNMVSINNVNFAFYNFLIMTNGKKNSDIFYLSQLFPYSEDSNSEKINIKSYLNYLRLLKTFNSFNEETDFALEDFFNNYDKKIPEILIEFLKFIRKPLDERTDEEKLYFLVNLPETEELFDISYE